MAEPRINYLAELNRMYDFCMSNMLSKSEILLLHALYMINNKKDWDAWFEADNYQIQRLTGGLSRQSITEARNKLKQRGRIEFRDGKRNQQSPFYRVIPFSGILDIQLDIQGDVLGDKVGDIQGDVLGDPLKNKTKLNKTKLKIYSDYSEQMKLSCLLFEKIQGRDPKAKEPNYQKWCEHIDKLIRVDKRSPGEIQDVIVWCQNDGFWQSNILSTEKLRKQFSQLVMKMQSETTKSLPGRDNRTGGGASSYDIDELDAIISNQQY